YERTNYGLTITVIPGEELEVRVKYDGNVYDEELVGRMDGHWQEVIEGILRDSRAKVATIECVGAAERRQLLEEFQGKVMDYPKDKTIVSQIDRQTQRTPEAVAVVYEEQELSYRELQERSNQLGHYLRKRGVRPEELVPICIERSIEMIVGILGILKAGGAYVPIDPAYPEERIRYMLEDTAARIMVSSADVRRSLPADLQPAVVELDREWEQISLEPVGGVEASVEPGQLAYVIYTSGSTGRPKGAMIEHEGLVNRLVWAQDQLGLSAEDAVLQ